MCIHLSGWHATIQQKSITLILFTFFLSQGVSSQNVGIGTTSPTEKLTVAGAVRIDRNSNTDAPHLLLHETEYDYTRLKFTNDGFSSYFNLSARPNDDGSMARFNLYNSAFGNNVFTATGNGRFGVNTVPTATLHCNAVNGTDPFRIQNNNITKFQIYSNNGVSVGASWANPIADVVRIEAPQMFIGFDGNHIPEHRLEVNGTITSFLNSNSNAPHINLYEDDYDYTRMKFSNNSTSSYFNLAARPSQDSSQARFNLFNSDFGNIFTATAAGRFGVNAVPAATLHCNSEAGTDPFRVQNNDFTKFRMFSNNAIVMGANWATPIANVIRMETPNLFIGYDGDHDPKQRLEVDGGIQIGLASVSPRDGVMQFDTTTKKFQIRVNGQWETVAFVEDEIEIGDTVFGGIVFWLDETAKHGLVISLSNVGSTYEWGTETCCYYDADGTGYYAGKLNTQLIINNTQGSSITCAAKACQDYSGGEYGDWYLPSKTEMATIFSNLVDPGLITLISGRYWTSNEEIDGTEVKAYSYASWDGNGILQVKTISNRVRAIRSF